MKIFYIVSIWFAIFGNFFGCTGETEQQSNLHSTNGPAVSICNENSTPLYFMRRREIDSATEVSWWFTVAANSCSHSVSWFSPEDTFYIQSANGHYLPPASEGYYHEVNETIICHPAILTKDGNGQLPYNGYDVYGSGKCSPGLVKKYSQSLHYSYEKSDLANNRAVYLVAKGNFDNKDRLQAPPEPMENPVDAIKNQIADVKAKISQAKNDIQECDAKIREWQTRKVYALDTNEIVNFEACSDAVKRNEIKTDIDSAKTKTLELLLNLLDAASGFLVQTLIKVDFVLADTFGFDSGALTSLLSRAGNEWTAKPLGSFAPSLNAALDSSYGNSHKEFLQYSHDGLTLLVTQGQALLATLDDEDAAFSYLAHAKAVREHLEGRDLAGKAKIDKDGWPEDSPVPHEIRAITIKQDIASQDQVRADRLETILKQWHSAGVPELVVGQRLLYLDSIKVLGQGFKAAVAEAPEVLKKLQNTLDGAIEAAKDVTTCLVKVGVSGDFSDWFEITQGKDYCTGAELSSVGRVISAAGLIAGSAKFWRLMGEGVGIAVHAKQVFRETERIVDSAKSIYDRMSNVADYYPSTKIPQRFDLKIGNESFHVHPNATKHMAEKIANRSQTHGLPMESQITLAHFEGAVSEAVSSGAWRNSIETGNLTKVGGWELKFSKRPDDPLPVIVHARMITRGE